MSFVERFIVLCPYLGESTIGGFHLVPVCSPYQLAVLLNVLFLE